ncbi:hypothetical protein HK405_007969 [Cladochytrium tenue]|nr:hypothetical protein HK405_007969 [Cladochytrium tenue]
MKQNSLMRLTLRMIDNIVHVVRVISQCPRVQRARAGDIVGDMLRLVQVAFNETPQFLTAGPVNFANLAVNTTIVINWISTAIVIGRSVRLGQREGVAAIAAAFEGLEPVLPLIMFEADAPGLAGTTRRADQAIGIAAASLFSLGDMFGGELIPQDPRRWMVKVAAAGYRVFTPAILYDYENSLGTVLEHSYSARENASYEETEDASLEETTVKDDEYVTIMRQNTENPGERKTLFPGDQWRASWFTRELYYMDNPEPTVGMAQLTKKFCGMTYLNIAADLKDSILSLPPSVEPIYEDIGYAEFFRYLMDAALYKPKHDEHSQQCGSEVAVSPEFSTSASL